MITVIMCTFAATYQALNTGAPASRLSDCYPHLPTYFSLLAREQHPLSTAVVWPDAAGLAKMAVGKNKRISKGKKGGKKKA
jgi:hypothetical protein